MSCIHGILQYCGWYCKEYCEYCQELDDEPLYDHIEHPALQVPIIEAHEITTSITTIPAPGSPYQTTTQIEITPPLLPLP